MNIKQYNKEIDIIKNEAISAINVMTALKIFLFLVAIVLFLTFSPLLILLGWVFFIAAKKVINLDMPDLQHYFDQMDKVDLPKIEKKS